MIFFAAAIIFTLLSIFLFLKSYSMLSIFFIILSVWMFIVALGNLMLAPILLDGYIVRLLMKRNGTLSKAEIQNYFSQCNSLDNILSKLEDRNIITIKNGSVSLIEANTKKGLKNKIMLWGTRKVKL